MKRPRGMEVVHWMMAALREESFTSLGCYPIFHYTTDGGCLHPDCIRENIWEVGRATRDGHNSQWHWAGYGVNWENPDLFCDHCNERIESAYAEDEVTEATRHIET